MRDEMGCGSSGGAREPRHLLLRARVCPDVLTCRQLVHDAVGGHGLDDVALNNMSLQCAHNILVDGTAHIRASLQIPCTSSCRSCRSRCGGRWAERCAGAVPWP